ncbi:MAG TPA: AMP-binding protein [Candidatus Baltobacteraceae bacterium]|jgi:2-aminobenzoate-CoA ligase|nr:AMP-binding protein [Candidatus Baltobacteraceae bacterium]
MGTGHIDRFTAEHLPPPDQMPDLRFELPQLQYPHSLNAAQRLLDRHIDEGNGHRRCIVAPGGTNWTYDGLAHRANRIARVLVDECGVGPGTRVLLRAPNSPMLAACWFAVLKAGGVAVTTMPLYRSSELRYMIEKARVSVALCDARLADELATACAGNGDVRIVLFETDAPDGLEARMAAKPAAFKNAATAAEDIALIGFTSGTTGTPKAAMHSHRSIMATCDTFGTLVLRPQAEDLFCGSPPLGFTFGLGGLLLFPLHAGAAALLLEKAGPEELLRNAAEFGVTTLFTAPIAYRAMTAMSQKYDIRTLRTCVSAGETLPKPVWDAWHAQTGIKIIDGIGSTEMLHIFIASPVENVRSGSTGQPVPGYVAEIHDDDGVPLPNGHVGRLAVKGPTGCMYLDDARQTTYVQNGWNYPGDAYRMDDDGYFYYVARTDDMIISAGYNISGPEVEQALLVHPDVKECAVVAKADPEHDTQIVKAYVVLADAACASADKSEELLHHCKALIAPYKAPREIEFVAELPRTETGKVQRYKLRQRASVE